jgi:MoxR-like ATPase
MSQDNKTFLSPQSSPTAKPVTLGAEATEQQPRGDARFNPWLRRRKCYAGATEHKKQQRIVQLLARLNEGVYEKENELALSLLSAVAGESVFMLGAPGVAKSLIARRLKYAFKDGKSFEYLMSRFSTPDEIFGPVAISKLKDHDKYERVVENYLPTADVVFLDEIWKAGPSIQNALLTVINEKIYRNGDTEIRVPMKALISASNELPARNEGLEALWDRFLVRLVVEGVKEIKNFNDMISMPIKTDLSDMDDSLKITDAEYKLWSAEIDKTEVPENVFNVIEVIRKKLQLHNADEKNAENQIYISDRRWRKIIRLLRTSAFLNDRTAVDLMDCFLIRDCIWNDEKQIATVKQIVNDAIEKHGYKLQVDFKSLKEELDDFQEEIKGETSFVKPETLSKLLEYKINNKVYYRVLLKGKFNYDMKDLIEKDIVDNLTKSDTYVRTKRWRKDMGDSDSVWVKKSNKKNQIFLSNGQYEFDRAGEYGFETNEETKQKTYTRKPHKAVEKTWDKKVAQYLAVTNRQKEELENYLTKDLGHLRTNTFVNPALANIVETHLTTTQKEIEKYVLEIRKIRDDYKKLK